MEKHVQLVGILNIVYRAFLLLASLIICCLTAWITHFIQFQIFQHGDAPFEVLNIVPLILLTVAAAMFIVSIFGILGGIGVLKRKEWGRIITLIASFVNLLHIPIGTALGVYTLWVLMNDQSVKIFNPTAGGQLAPPAA
jgi:uncharacterized membrane protein